MKWKMTVLWILQLVCAGILLFTAWSKLSSQPNAILIFSELGMEPAGRYIIGVIELLAALFLISGRAAALGGLLAVGTMCGAIIAHISILGLNVRGDHGRHVMMLAIVATSAAIVTVVRRRQLPIIGNTFAE